MRYLRATLLSLVIGGALGTISQASAQQYRPSWQNFRQGTIMPPIQPNYGGNRYVAPPAYVPPPQHYQPYNQVNPFTGQPNNPYGAPPPQVYVNPGIAPRPMPLNPNITCPGCAVGLQPPPPPRQLPQAPQNYNPYQYSAPSTFYAPPATSTRRNSNYNTYNYDSGRPAWVPW